MMKTAITRFVSPRFASALVLTGIFILASSLRVAAQQPGSNAVRVQRQAMHKLAYLAGRWSGPVTIMRGPGQSMHFTQTENVQYKLGGLVLLVEGKSTTAGGKTVFSALATISFDNASHTYRIRAYNNGHYVDAKLSLLPHGFSWSFLAGPVRMVNTMHLTAKGEWKEVSEVAMGGAPPRPSVRMLLHRLS